MRITTPIANPEGMLVSADAVIPYTVTAVDAFGNTLKGYSSYAGSAFIASIAVSMMVFPMATSVMREVFSQAPASEKEAALALGATRTAMVRSVVIPFGRSGIVGGTMLALGRALGETISVVLIISQTYEIKPNVLDELHRAVAGISKLRDLGEVLRIAAHFGTEQVGKHVIEYDHDQTARRRGHDLALAVGLGLRGMI